MNHLPHKFRYALKTLIWSPFELLRLARVAWTTFKFRYIHRCAEPHTIIGESTVMINTANIRIGSGCLIQDRVYLRAGVDGSIEVGDGAALNSFVQIYGHGGVKIGASTQIGPGTIITTSGHDYRATDLAPDNAPIILGDRVWIGANCTILPGVTIGDKAVIGAGAVVAEDIPESCVAVGVPARVIRHFDNGRVEDSTHGTAEVQSVGKSKKTINR
jgi:acetyltransferase-like isoleucine patch superfamily enzyme